ncbi:hypothetical protein Tco_0967803 [Tanacetum coccineum]
MFLKYSTGQIPPKKSRGKGSQGKKTVDTPAADVDVFEEFEPEPAKKKTASRRVVKKKVTISTADNIIPDPDVALELGKSISLTETVEEEVARKVHATHARIVTESVLEPARRRPSSIAQKLKGVQSLTLEEQEAAYTMKALKESKKPSRRQPGTGGLSEGIGSIPGVPDESTVVSATSSEGTSTKPTVLDEEKIYSDKEDNDKSIDLEMTDEEETKDDFVQGDADISDVAKADVKKTEEVKDDAKKAELPQTSSSLSVSSGFGDQFLKLSSNTSLVSTVKDNTDAMINSLLEVKIESKVPHIRSPSVLRLRFEKLEKDVSKLKNIDHSAKTIGTLKSQVLTVVDIYLESKLGDALQKAL